MDEHLATIWESIADCLPDEIALVHGGARRTWREFEQRSARFFAALKLRAVPANVNYRYLDDERRQLLQQSDTGHDPPPPVGVLPAPYDHPGARRELSFALVDAAAQEQFGTTAGAAGGDLF